MGHLDINSIKIAMTHTRSWKQQKKNVINGKFIALLLTVIIDKRIKEEALNCFDKSL